MAHMCVCVTELRGNIALKKNKQKIIPCSFWHIHLTLRFCGFFWGMLSGGVDVWPIRNQTHAPNGDSFRFALCRCVFCKEHGPYLTLKKIKVTLSHLHTLKKKNGVLNLPNFILSSGCTKKNHLDPDTLFP